MNCEICKRRLSKKKSFLWINGLIGFKDLRVCEECNLCLGEQMDLFFLNKSQEVKQNGSTKNIKG